MAENTDFSILNPKTGHQTIAGTEYHHVTPTEMNNTKSLYHWFVYFILLSGFKNVKIKQNPGYNPSKNMDKIIKYSTEGDRGN